MPLHVIGINHNTAPVEIREQVVFSGEEISRADARMADLPGITEVALLSTCNRTEIYAFGDPQTRGVIREWLMGELGLESSVSEVFFELEGDEAIRHIFRVACGLDSMVLGEPQILGQMKDAFRSAQDAHSINSNLSRLFQHTFSVAKKVRTDTDIGANPVSVAYAAVSLAQQFFSGFKKHTALLIGAGVTIELVAKHLARKQIGRLFVANRSLERAQNLASQFGGYALPLSELNGTLPEADILITSTAATEPVVTREQMINAIRQRKRKPIFAVDIAVPRDIEASVAELDDVYLYSIDDLDKVIVEGQQSRESAAIDANRILDDEIRRYLDMERSKEVAPIIAALREQSDEIRQQVLKQAMKRLHGGADGDEVLEYLSASLMKKLLHQPSVRLREAGEKSDQEMIRSAVELFGLSDQDE
jgi:glutamyl-tRNA reductase